MALSGPAAGFIGASVTLVLVIIFMILMVILVRQCLAFLAKRNHLRAQMEQHQRQRQNQQRQRRGSITEPVPATFDWHHSIRIAGTPPPSYVEAKKLPSFEDGVEGGEKQEHVVTLSKEQEDEVDSKMDSKEEQEEAFVASGHSTTSAATGQSTNDGVSGGSTSRSHDHQGRSHDHASGNVTVQIDIENHSGEESRTFSTGYTEYGVAS